MQKESAAMLSEAERWSFKINANISKASRLADQRKTEADGSLVLHVMNWSIWWAEQIDLMMKSFYNISSGDNECPIHLSSLFFY